MNNQDILRAGSGKGGKETIRICKVFGQRAYSWGKVCLFSAIISSMFCSAVHGQDGGFVPRLQAGYFYGLSGPSWFVTPAAVMEAVEALGYPEPVQKDLRLMADMWRNEVQAYCASLEYIRPVRSWGLFMLAGGMLRMEKARRYAEVSYNPTYIFSGTEMTSRGGGLYLGAGIEQRKGNWYASFSFAPGYFNFSRDFLHYFYLDPQLTGSPFDRTFRHREFSSGMMALISSDIGYRYRKFGIAATGRCMLDGGEQGKYGMVGAGVLVTYELTAP